MEQLKEFFYDPKKGFISAAKLYLKLNKTIPLATINEFLKKQKINPISLENRRKPRAMEGILETNKPTLQSDNGTEFLSHHFQTLLKKTNAQHTTAEVGNHNKQGIVERFNRTIEGMIIKYQESNRFVNALEDLVYNYNNTFHRSIGDTPEKRYNSNPNSGTIKISDDFNHGFIIGDKVRILKTKKAFQKGSEAKYSDSVYEIVSGDGYVFTIKSPDDEVLQKKYKYYQLQKISEVEKYKIEVINRPVPKSLKQLRNKREIEELRVYTSPTSTKKRQINKSVDLYPIVDSRNQSNKRKSVNSYW
jgi:hypothetical protein